MNKIKKILKWIRDNFYSIGETLCIILAILNMINHQFIWSVYYWLGVLIMDLYSELKFLRKELVDFTKYQFDVNKLNTEFQEVTIKYFKLLEK